MKRLVFRCFRFFLVRFVGRRRTEHLIVRTAQAVGSDLLCIAYRDMGILKYEDSHVSGESHLITDFLPEHVKSANPTFFDVGANTGEYSAELRRQFPVASIYAFEPNVNAYEIMREALSPLGVRCFNLGLSSSSESRTIYTYEHEAASQHASTYKEVLTDLHGAARVTGMEFKTTTADEFCDKNRIDFIDFMKIDTEGHELEVLNGAKGMIAAGKIHLIQFEFNEMNIISRVFLRDFYELLKGYRIYRLDTDGLIPLFSYNSTNEIFKFQNLLAVNERIEAER
ncbi:MAG: FkbM family methyltransferase [Acidobacteriota bacterium]|nr:FkbM family methyltransferase [Acidobacteriota bacterium]